MKAFSGFLLLLALCAPGAEAQDMPPAPFQVESVVRPIAARALAPDQPRKLIVIDLGTAEDGAKPAFTEPGAAVTVLYERGASSAFVVEIVKSCAFVCGFEEGETCHWQALLAPEPDARLLGEPLLALPVADPKRSVPYQAWTPSPASAVRWRDGFARPVWPEQDPSEIRIDDWRPDGGRLSASLRLASGEVQPIEDQGCTATDAAGMVALACPSLSILAADGVPLLVSWTDYHPAAAVPVARLTIEGREAVLVRFSTKIDILHGLLVRDGDRWVPLIRPTDYPTVC
jgi:hypothetical protein